MDYVKTMGVDHFIQRLYVHWDITTLCEYKCSYCYAHKQYGNQWGNLGLWKKQLTVIDELKKSTLPLFVGLLGGEPTSHQRYFQLLDILNEEVITHTSSRLYVTTNGAKSPEFFDRHKNVDGRVFMLWSLHPEFVDFNNFYANIMLMRQKGYRNKINLMLHPNPKYWDDIKRWYDKLCNIEDAIIHPHFIYEGFNKDVDYSPEFYEFFKFLENHRDKEFVFSDGDTEHVLGDYEVFTRGLNRFKGWNCWQNNFEITNNCQISDQCFNSIPMDIPKNFFRDIKHIEPKRCPHDFCSCDGLMKVYKERD